MELNNKPDKKSFSEIEYDIFGIIPLISKFLHYFLNNPKNIINIQSSLASSFSNILV